MDKICGLRHYPLEIENQIFELTNKVGDLIKNQNELVEGYNELKALMKRAGWTNDYDEDDK